MPPSVVACRVVRSSVAWPKCTSAVSKSAALACSSEGQVQSPCWLGQSRCLPPALQGYLGEPLPCGMLMPIIIPSVIRGWDLEAIPGTLPATGDDRLRRLVADLAARLGKLQATPAQLCLGPGGLARLL